MIDDLDRNPDGTLTAEASARFLAAFDRDFPHGTLCVCGDCATKAIGVILERLDGTDRTAVAVATGIAPVELDALGSVAAGEDFPLGQACSITDPDCEACQ